MCMCRSREGEGGAAGMDVNLLRLMRVFRVLRIANKLQSMQKVLGALVASLKPVVSALLLLFIIAGLYAVVGCNLFATRYPNAEEDFGSFSRAFISLLGIATGTQTCCVLCVSVNGTELVSFGIYRISSWSLVSGDADHCTINSPGGY